jgi:hypothetical protein
MELSDATGENVVAAMEQEFQHDTGDRAVQLNAWMPAWRCGAEKELKILSTWVYCETAPVSAAPAPTMQQVFRLHTKSGRPYRSPSKSIMSIIVKRIARRQPGISEADRTRETSLSSDHAHAGCSCYQTLLINFSWIEVDG